MGAVETRNFLLGLIIAGTPILYFILLTTPFYTQLIALETIVVISCALFAGLISWYLAISSLTTLLQRERVWNFTLKEHLNFLLFGILITWAYATFLTVMIEVFVGLEKDRVVILLFGCIVYLALYPFIDLYYLSKHGRDATFTGQHLLEAIIEQITNKVKKRYVATGITYFLLIIIPIIILSWYLSFLTAVVSWVIVLPLFYLGILTGIRGAKDLLTWRLVRKLHWKEYKQLGFVEVDRQSTKILGFIPKFEFKGSLLLGLAILLFGTTIYEIIADSSTLLFSMTTTGIVSLFFVIQTLIFKGRSTLTEIFNSWNRWKLSTHKSFVYAFLFPAFIGIALFTTLSLEIVANYPNILQNFLQITGLSENLNFLRLILLLDNILILGLMGYYYLLPTTDMGHDLVETAQKYAEDGNLNPMLNLLSFNRNPWMIRNWRTAVEIRSKALGIYLKTDLPLLTLKRTEQMLHIISTFLSARNPDYQNFESYSAFYTRLLDSNHDLITPKRVQFLVHEIKRKQTFQDRESLHGDFILKHNIGRAQVALLESWSCSVKIKPEYLTLKILQDVYKVLPDKSHLKGRDDIYEDAWRNWEHLVKNLDNKLKIEFLTLSGGGPEEISPKTQQKFALAEQERIKAQINDIINSLANKNAEFQQQTDELIVINRKYPGLITNEEHYKFIKVLLDSQDTQDEMWIAGQVETIIREASDNILSQTIDLIVEYIIKPTLGYNLVYVWSTLIKITPELIEPRHLQALIDGVYITQKQSVGVPIAWNSLKSWAKYLVQNPDFFIAQKDSVLVQNLYEAIVLNYSYIGDYGRTQIIIPYFEQFKQKFVTIDLLNRYIARITTAGSSPITAKFFLKYTHEMISESVFKVLEQHLLKEQISKEEYPTYVLKFAELSPQSIPKSTIQILKTHTNAQPEEYVAFWTRITEIEAIYIDQGIIQDIALIRNHNQTISFWTAILQNIEFQKTFLTESLTYSEELLNTTNPIESLTFWATILVMQKFNPKYYDLLKVLMTQIVQEFQIANGEVQNTFLNYIEQYWNYLIRHQGKAVSLTLLQEQLSGLEPACQRTSFKNRIKKLLKGKMLI